MSEGENILEWTLSSDLCGSFSDQITINTYLDPNPDAGNDQEICENFTNLNANNPNTDETGTWNIISGSGVVQNTNDPNTLITNLSEGENILEWTLSSDLCGSFSDQISLNYINSNINVNAGQNMQLCDNNTYLNANTPSNIESGYWSVIAGTAVFEDINNPNTMIDNLSIGDNILEWTIYDPCESLSDQLVITFDTMNISAENISNYTNYNISCPGDNNGSIDLVITGGYPPYTYSWIGPSNFTSQSEDINELSSGNYQCTVTDNIMCEKIISIYLDQPPEIELELLDFEDLDCFENGYIEYSASGGAGVLTGSINTYNTENSWDENVSFTWNDNGIYYTSYEDFNQWDGTISLTTTDENGCQSDTIEINVQSWDDPIAQFNVSTYNAMMNEIIEFSDVSFSEASIVSWTWDFGDGNMGNNPDYTTHSYEANGSYTVCLNIEDANGCVSTECKIINIYSDNNIFIPNIFTINNDNINEEFKPIINGVLESSYHMAIYDRWGKILFSTNDHQEGWNGKYHGKQVSQDVYSYKINYLTISGEQKKYIGKVMLMK